MDPTWKFIFFLAAVICFFIAALSTVRPIERAGVLLPLGLAFFAIPFMWDAAEAM